MKRLFFYFLSAIALLSGCEKAEDVGLPNQDNIIVSGDASSTTLPEVLYAFIDGEDAQDGNFKTRTYVNNTNKIVWHSGDAISYFTGTKHNAKYVKNVTDGSEDAVFTLDESVQAREGDAVSKSYAVYPYDANTSVVRRDGTDVINVYFPTTQISSSDPKTEKSFGKGSNIMVATGEIGNNELLFRNACGYLIIQLDSPQENIQPIIQSIKLTARGGEKIAGNANITIGEDGIPSVTMIDDASASSTITIDCTNVTYENVGKQGVLLTGQDKAEFWFALPPVTLSQGISIEVNAVDANNQLKFFKETSREIKIERNIPQPMASLNFENHYALRYKTESGKKLDFDNGAFKSGENNASISQYFDKNLGCFVVNFEAPLTTIGVEAFKEMDITSITIPGTVTEIGKDAFYKCDKLAELTLAPSPTNSTLKVGQDTKGTDEGLFAYCPLETINFNRQVKYNYDCNDEEGREGIFSFHDGDYRPTKTTITIGEQVTTIPEAAFACAAIEAITIPATVTKIGQQAFSYCRPLDTMTLGHNDPKTIPTLHINVFTQSSIESKAGSIVVQSNEIAKVLRETEPWKKYNIITVSNSGN